MAVGIFSILRSSGKAHLLLRPGPGSVQAGLSQRFLLRWQSESRTETERCLNLQGCKAFLSCQCCHTSASFLAFLPGCSGHRNAASGQHPEICEGAAALTPAGNRKSIYGEGWMLDEPCSL
ncbi:hypothetical protein OJAV_G00034160 [Oryzias javanicus]|uniref:Uncharacterized protein n=1 Tax=Oryzias javanicus TaxID=123683 RepID=A0A437DFP5_ORYJA|nr:hypothetical protein OJAV_G00034160 [Oryzias javanicus]